MKADQSKPRNLKSAIPWLVIPTLLFIAALWIDLTPLLRGPAEWPFEWRWPLRANVLPDRMLVPFVVLGLYALACAWWLRVLGPGRRSRKAERLFLLFLTVAAPLIQLALAFAVVRQPLNELFAPTISPLNSGYFNTAIDITDLNQYLAQYPSIMPTLANHVQTHPPGPVVMQWLGWRFFEAWPALADTVAMPLRTLQCHNPGIMALDNPQIASAAVGMLLPLIGAMAVWPIFAFGKRIVGVSVAAIAAALFVVLPLFAMWPAQWDQLYPLLFFSGLYLAHVGLESRSLWRIFLAGIPLSVATFFSIGNLVMIGIVGLYCLIWLIVERRLTWRGAGMKSALLMAGAFGLGCASIWLLYTVLYQVNPFEVVATGSRLAFESTTGRRSYALWLAWNLIDFATFLSLPIVLLLIINLVRSRGVGLPRSIWPLTVATLMTLVLLDLSGSVRGEVGRLWIYFGPLFVLIALAENREADAHGDLQLTTPYAQYGIVMLLIGLVGLQLLIMNTRWLVSDNYLGEPPDRTANYDPPNPASVTPVSFDHQIALRGYAAKASSSAVELTLYWQALTQPPHAYTVFTHVFDANGRQVGQQDNMPVRDQLPTSCWRPGEFVGDPYAIPLKEGARGPFKIEVGLYRADTGIRLPRDDAEGDSATLEAP